jgi:hypothetical protein
MTSRIARNRWAVSRITLRPHDPTTGEEVEKEEVVRGYEYERGQYVTFTPDELKALDLESSKVIDLEIFVPRVRHEGLRRSSERKRHPRGRACPVCLARQKARQAASPRPRTRSSNPVPSSEESAANSSTPLSLGRNIREALSGLCGT